MKTFSEFIAESEQQSGALAAHLARTAAGRESQSGTVGGDKKKFNLKQLLINLFKYPLMTIKIISAIHFEAFLLWKKGAIYRSRNKKIKNNLSFEKNS